MGADRTDKIDRVDDNGVERFVERDLEGFGLGMRDAYLETQTAHQVRCAGVVVVGVKVEDYTAVEGRHVVENFVEIHFHTPKWEGEFENTAFSKDTACFESAAHQMDKLLADAQS